VLYAQELQIAPDIKLWESEGENETTDNFEKGSSSLIVNSKTTGQLVDVRRLTDDHTTLNCVEFYRNRCFLPSQLKPKQTRD
jgi:hypothetical protein